MKVRDGNPNTILASSHFEVGVPNVHEPIFPLEVVRDGAFNFADISVSAQNTNFGIPKQ